MKDGTIHQVNVSRGGVPKLPIEVGDVSKSGLAGDACAKTDIHGGPLQALSLFSLELIESLAAEGHPIQPGSVGENVTARGLDWARLMPGTRLRLGADVLIELTCYADPCKTIAGSFSDGNMNRLHQQRHPGHSRLYAQVLHEGLIRAGDAISIEAAPETTTAALTPLQLAYVNVYVTDLARSMEFFEKTLGLGLQFGDAAFGYASFDAGPIRIGLAQIDPDDDDSRALVGRQTGVGFGVVDLKAAYAALRERGVAFSMPPSKQPWGGFMALFEDPDENVFYLDELQGD